MGEQTHPCQETRRERHQRGIQLWPSFMPLYTPSCRQCNRWSKAIATNNATLDLCGIKALTLEESLWEASMENGERTCLKASHSSLEFIHGPLCTT